jgi:hypothetical protein
MEDTKNPLEWIRQRLDAGEMAWALEQIRSLISQGARTPDTYRLLALALLKEGSHDDAAEALREARLAGTSAVTEVAFGRFLNKEGHRRAALSCFSHAITVDPHNDDALALACMHHADAGQTELAVEYGQKCLEAREQQGGTAEPVQPARPTAFDPTSPRKNIIAFSLFGDDPYYWDCAIGSASMALAIFPEWRCRFYCDGKVPETVRRSLLRLKSELHVLERGSENWSGLFWRFHAFDDPDVSVVLIRDVDSPFTLRERLCVDEWLDSEFPFHAIRDHLYHCEPMMAGLWGGWTKLLPPIAPLIAKARDETTDRYADQKFLRRHIWPRLRNATLVHDRFFTLGETRRPPEHATGAITHIGMSWPKARRAR